MSGAAVLGNSDEMTARGPICCVVGCAALVGLLGCASVEKGAAEVPAAAATNAVTVGAVSAPAFEPPADGYAWEDLARLAASNSAAAKVLLLESEAERRQVAVDTGWRNPQLRMGGSSMTEDERVLKGSGQREWTDKDYDGYATSLRVYVANPFVNRWLRERGSARALAVEAEAEEARYAVYCEVKSLCLESDLLRSEIDVLQRMIALRQQMRDTCDEQAKAGVACALDIIRTETRLASLRSELGAKELAQRQTLRRIALLAGLPAERVRLRARGSARPPLDALLSGVALTDLAFLRRPDLQRAVHEREEAQRGLGAAKAGNIPWFEYVEGSYANGNRHTSSVEEGGGSGDRAREDETEWQARVALTLPVFNWLGDEVRLNRARLEAAEMRVQGRYDQIRREVEGVLEDYRYVRAEHDRVASENQRLVEALTAQIEALANEAAIPRAEVLGAREEVLDYTRTTLRAEREFLRMEQYLETVSGGSLTSSP